MTMQPNCFDSRPKISRINQPESVLVRSAKGGFEQASGVTLTKSCRRNNPRGDAFPHNVGLATALELFKGGVQNFAHLRKCLRAERPT
jgi:hypothetical protein